MDLGTLHRLATEWNARVSGRRYGGLERLDPRRVALRLGEERWALLLDESACGVFPEVRAPALPALPTSLRYLDEALRGFEALEATAEPGRLRLVGRIRHAARELTLVGPPRSFLLLLEGDEPRAGYRRPLDRPWRAYLPVFDAGAGDGPPGEAALEAWRARHDEPLRDVALARLSRALTPTLAREVRHRAGCDEPAAVSRAAREVIEEAAAGAGPAWVYPAGERPPLVSAARLSHDGRAAQRCSSVLEAVALLDREELEPRRLEVYRRAAARPLERRAARARRALQKLSAEQAEAATRAELERHAHALYAHGARLPRGLSSTRLPDPADSSHELEIPLDPARNGIENATALLRRASRLARRPEALARRTAEVQADLEGAQTEAARIRGSAGWAELDAAGVLAAEERVAPDSVTEREEASRNEPYRLVTQEGWAVLVGRNERQNEFLTHRLARPDDLWFHAEHVPGSHVLLRRGSRSGEPGARTLEEVASYAAYMSKARSSSQVPVLMAEKRHVRKARGGPGKVTVERGKTLMVSPRKPGG